MGYAMGGTCRRGGRGPLLNWQRKGFVPDHVKHPERYTVYTLDDAVTVGGGERGEGISAAGDAGEMRRVSGADALFVENLRSASGIICKCQWPMSHSSLNCVRTVILLHI